MPVSSFELMESNKETHSAKVGEFIDLYISDPPPKTGDRVNPIFFKYSSDLIELYSEKVLTISEFVPK